MENVKLWVLSVCVFSVIISIYKVLLPNGNIKKTGITVFSVLLIFIMIKPLFSAKNEFQNLDLYIENDFFSEAATLNNKKIYKDAIIKTVSDTLNKHQIVFEEIAVDMNITNENNIEINNICLSVDSESDDEKIKDIIETETGFSKEIIIINR